MRSSRAGLGLLIITGVVAVSSLRAKESDNRLPIAWRYVQEGPLTVMRKAKPIDSVEVTKACDWNGFEFAPLR
jgi:hypothetical protein